MRERKTKTLVLKYAAFQPSGPNLKQLLAEALTKQSTIGERREALGPGDESPIWRLIGQYVIEPEFLFGVLMRYMPGTNPIFLVDDPAASSLTVEQLAAPQTDDGKRRELLEGTLFFGVIDNHVVIMQTMSLRSEHLEEHLLWLLHHASLVPRANIVRLVDQLPAAIKERVEKQGVREVLLKGDLLDEKEWKFLPEDSSIPKPAELLATKTTIHDHELVASDATKSTSIVSALKSLLKPDEAAKINVDDLENSNIEYTLKIRYKSSTTDDGQRLMNTLGSALRNAEGVHAKVQLVGGGTISGNQLRLSERIRINTNDGAPNPYEVFEAMRTWLKEKLKSGEVAAS